MTGHDEAIARLRRAAQQVSLRQASDAFLASLTTRNLAWRAALPAVVMARHLPEHRYVKQTRYSGADNCGVCGFNEIEEQYGVSPGRLAGQIEALGAQRPLPQTADVEVLFAPGSLWIARLSDGRYAIYYKLARRWRWMTGPRDEVLALVPEPIFAEAVEAVVGCQD